MALQLNVCFESFDVLKQTIDNFSKNEFHPIVTGDGHKMKVCQVLTEFEEYVLA